MHTAHPTTYAILKPQGITSLAVGVIQDEEKQLGFFGVDNPDPAMVPIITSLIRVAGYFVSTFLKRRDLLRKLNRLSYHDPLPGAFNRHALEQYYHNDTLSSGPFPAKRTRKYRKKRNESLVFCGMLVYAARGARRLASNCVGDSQPSAECARGVLDAPVTVKDELLRRVVAAYRHVESFQRQGSVDAVGKGIAHNFSGTQILDDGQVEPAFPGGNVGDIAHPGLIWLFKEEVSLHEIGGNGMTVPGVGCDLIGPASCRNDSSSPHLTVDPLAGTAEFRLEHVVETVQPQGRILLV